MLLSALVRRHRRELVLLAPCWPSTGCGSGSTPPPRADRDLVTRTIRAAPTRVVVIGRSPVETVIDFGSPDRRVGIAHLDAGQPVGQPPTT
ncbi:hypothetical protein [Streptoalloteichus hindustanus]|uniref:Uncharacterized protein n=1 Tax=Streptoalloteichus hindustanus TaxID=2017 RepID=A0A1M5FKS1_STRHI|nr:hypothetical protein [Streptoalloteichus hindustanus]SHF92207.1 hypothetical protein SAMN05444320_105489 [Streptoalloteichus hindustanus]